MAFRRQRDEWDDFLARHGSELRTCGIPDEVVAGRRRFLVFLDHGYDAENPHAVFDTSTLSDEQISTLADLVGDHVDERYRVPIRSRWRGGE